MIEYDKCVFSQIYHTWFVYLESGEKVLVVIECELRSIYCVARILTHCTQILMNTLAKTEIIYPKNVRANVKVVFIQKVRFILKISILLSWAWNLNLVFTDIGGKFEFQVQDSDLEYFFLEIWKNITHSEKKMPLAIHFT